MTLLQRSGSFCLPSPLWELWEGELQRHLAVVPLSRSRKHGKLRCSTRPKPNNPSDALLACDLRLFVRAGGKHTAAWPGQKSCSLRTALLFQISAYKSVIKAGWWDLLQSRSHRVGGDTRWAPAALLLSPSEVWICSSRCSWQSEQPSVCVGAALTPSWSSVHQVHFRVLGRGERMEVFLMERFQFFCCSSAQPFRSGKVRRFVCPTPFQGPVSGDAEAGPRPPLHHSRHLNPFVLVAFSGTVTAAQLFNIDQSLLLSSSFITSPSHSLSSSSSFSLLQPPAVTLCFSHNASCSPQY